MHERRLRAFDLPLSAAAAQLPHGFDQKKNSVHPRVSVGKTAAMSVERELTDRRSPLVRDDRPALACGAKPERFERQQHGDGERILDLDDVDGVVRDPGHRHRDSGRRREARQVDARHVSARRGPA